MPVNEFRKLKEPLPSPFQNCLAGFHIVTVVRDTRYPVKYRFLLFTPQLCRFFSLTVSWQSAGRRDLDHFFGVSCRCQRCVPLPAIVLASIRVVTDTTNDEGWQDIQKTSGFHLKTENITRIVLQAVLVKFASNDFVP